MLRNYTKNMIYLIAMIFVIIMTAGCQKQTAYDTFSLYEGKWEKKDFEGMYDMLSTNAKKGISKDEFITRYTNIYGGIEARNIDIKINNEDKDKSDISFTINMDTLAGKLEIPEYKVTMIKEKVDGNNQWTVDWNESMIFPRMDKDDKVSVERFNAKRGEIYDRNGKGLAINDTVINIGIQPSEFIEDKESNIAKMAKILDIKESYIEEKLSKNSNPEYFVPIVKLLPSEKEKISQVMEIKGVKHNKPEGRIYPGGEAFGSLIGYIRPINADELEKYKGEGYSSTSMLGITGLEQEYEKRLREDKGGVIYISKQENGKEIEKIEIARKESKNGEDIKLSIDFDLQKKIYEQMNKDLGASTAINPKNGEILAMVSSPSFDSNLYTTYIPESVREIWKNNSNQQFENRFNNVYSPGSTFKLITAIIGLENKIINPNESIDIKGNRWQPNESWGEYKVTRVTDTKHPINLNDAFVYSDNIYFAMKAIEIGKKDFVEESIKFGFDEKLPIDFTIEKSQVANGNNIEDDMLLANTAYGQGEVLMSPLHVTLAYSSIVNKGNIMKPILELKEGNKYEIWKKNVVSKENVEILLNSLTQVIEHKSGTGNDAKINGIKLAGKTGTAELKKSLDDKEGKENGWFVCMDTENPEIVISMIIEDVKGRGGSHYVVPKVKNIMSYYLNK